VGRVIDLICYLLPRYPLPLTEPPAHATYKIPHAHRVLPGRQDHALPFRLWAFAALPPSAEPRFWLQLQQAATRLSSVLRPPAATARTWSPTVLVTVQPGSRQ
jgi:hypothetical protein